MKQRVLVKGPALSSSGYGEHARMILRALRHYSKHFEIFVENISWGQTGHLVYDTEEKRWIDFMIQKTRQYTEQGGQFDVSLQVTIPLEWTKIAPLNIGVTAGIETTKIAPQWIEKCEVVDKIIVPSEHAKYGFTNTSYNGTNPQTGEEVVLQNTTPVEVVHYPVKDTVPAPIDLNLDFDFNFAVVAQWGPRKNLDNTIRWFIEEFKGEQVGLVVKANTRKNNYADRLHCEERLKHILNAYPDRQCKIYLVHGNMSEEEMAGLYTHPQVKAMVSATHGEGFGLPLFEAVYNELPVVAPNWSGHVDFLYAPKKDKKGKVKSRPHFAKVDYHMAPIQQEAVWEGVLQPDSQWCFPKESSFRTALRETYKNYGPRKSEAKKLSSHIKKVFTSENIYKKILNIVRPGLGDEVQLEPRPIEGISFCIPTSGQRPEKLQHTLESIRKQTWGSIPYEIVICGNVVELGESPPSSPIKLVNKAQEASSGFVGALRNNAADTAQYDTLVFCDDDIILEETWLEETLKFSEESGWKVLGNKILNPDGSRHWDRATLVPRVLVDYDHPAADKNLMQTSGFLLVRKETYEQVKWDESKLVYADRINKGIPEDVQYNLDLHQQDIPLSFNVNATVWHNDGRYTQIKNTTLLKEVIEKHHGITVHNYTDEKFEKLVSGGD